MTAPTTYAPGVYGISDAEYHGIKDALSCSGAKKLLPPSCPAIFRYELDNPPQSKPHFDFGHLAHKKVLGIGAPIREVKADDWRTAKAQQERRDAYAAGEIPALTSEIAVVDAMAQKIREHPIASALLNPDTGAPERSLFAVDEQSGVPLRSRLDWLPTPILGRRMIIPDYKTTVSAEPDAIAKAVASYQYLMQDVFYRDMIIANELDEDPAFVFIFQMKTAPYLVTVAELDSDAKAVGRGLNRRAIDLYAECVSNDEWPGYATDVVSISLPRWATYQYEEFL